MATTSKAASAKTAVKTAARKVAAKPAATAATTTAAKRKPAVKARVAPATKAATPVNKAAPMPKAKPQAEQKEKIKKAKLVRDSFTMPEAEYAVLGEVKKACLKAGIEVKKSELLRVGVALIRKLDLAQLKEILALLPALKAGRPKNK